MILPVIVFVLRQWDSSGYIHYIGILGHVINTHNYGILLDNGCIVYCLKILHSNVIFLWEKENKMYIKHSLQNY